MKLIALVFLFPACTATLVTAPGGDSGSAYAPVNEQTRAGVTKYLNQGIDSIIKSRREDAYRQMFDACGGKYKIEAEGPHSEGGAVVAVSPSTSLVADSQYWYIQFTCVPSK